MLYSMLEDKEMCYISLHAECALQIDTNEFLTEDSLVEARKNQGFYCDRVNDNILQRVYSCKEYAGRDLCLDFARISELYEKGAPEFFSYIYNSFYSKNRCVYFLNVKRKLYDQMKFSDKIQKIDENDDNISFCYGNVLVCKKYAELISRQNQLFAEKLENLVLKSTDSCPDELHRSVPVYLSKYINIKKMADIDAKMLRYAIYALARNMVDKKVISDVYTLNRDVNFFFQTLNGAYVTTQLAQLFGVDFVFLDHLGPQKGMHRKSFEKYIRDNSKYIIVADVICLGGEVGRAKTIIEYFGGKVLSEVCLVDIMTVQPLYANNRISLYTVSNSCNKINYMIKTDLCTVCGRS